MNRIITDYVLPGVVAIITITASYQTYSIMSAERRAKAAHVNITAEQWAATLHVCQTPENVSHIEQHVVYCHSGTRVSVPDALVIYKFNTTVAAGQSNSAVSTPSPLVDTSP